MANYKQKIIAFVLILLLAVLSNPLITSASENRPAYSKGDLDGDAVIDSTDYLIVKKIFLNSYRAEAKQVFAADVNDDGSIDSFDYLLIKRHIFGNYSIKADVMKEQIPSTENQIEQIKLDYIEYVKKDEPKYSDLTVSDIICGKYYGPYSGCYLIFIASNRVGFPAAVTTKTIAGYTFVFSDGQLPLIYKDSNFYQLKEAYETGFITQEDVYDLSCYFSPYRSDWTK